MAVVQKLIHRTREVVAGAIAVRGFRTHRTKVPMNLGALSKLGLVAIGRDFAAELCVASVSLYQGDALGHATRISDAPGRRHLLTLDPDPKFRQVS